MRFSWVAVAIIYPMILTGSQISWAIKMCGKVITVVRKFSWAIKNSLLMGIFWAFEFCIPLKF